MNFYLNLKFRLIFKNQVQDEMTSQTIRKHVQPSKLSFHFHLNFLSHRFQFLCKQKKNFWRLFILSLVQQQKKRFLTQNTWINFKEEKKLWYLLESEEYKKKKCLQISKNKGRSSQLIKMNLQKKNSFMNCNGKKILRWNKNKIA